MIKIMVDSSSDCKKEDNLYDLFVPLAVNIGGKEYMDGIDLDSNTFYSILTSTKEFPRTSQPSPDDFINIFKKIKEDGDTLIYFALSSSLSGTYQGACIAKTMVDYDKIYIIDTKTVTHMIGIIVKYARKLIDDGASAEEIVEKCEDLKTRVKAVAGVDTLEYLRRGGRLSSASATVGTLAKIKPVVTVTKEGTVEVIGKCIGLGRAMQYIVEKLDSYELDTDFPVSSIFTYGEENCISLEERLAATGYKIDGRVQVGSTIGTHVGPGVYGVIFVTK